MLKLYSSQLGVPILVGAQLEEVVVRNERLPIILFLNFHSIDSDFAQTCFCNLVGGLLGYTDILLTLFVGLCRYAAHPYKFLPRSVADVWWVFSGTLCVFLLSH